MSITLQGIGDPVQLEEVGGVLGGKDTKIVPAAPAVVLMDPKYAFNVGNAQRGCSNFGIEQLWWTGTRVSVAEGDNGRLPKEERMKGWAKTALINHQRPFDLFKKLRVPILGIEMVKGATNLFHYIHPSNAVYVFGPEDGSIHDAVKSFCHEFIQIPSNHCLNLSCSISVVLAFRRFSLIQQGLEEDKPVSEWLKEHRGVL